MLRIIYSFLSVTVLGALLGIGLAIAAKVLAVIKDERIEKVDEILPGVNCGGCGYAGCSAYAEAIVKDDADITLCAPGGAETAKSIAAIMGKEVSVSGEKKVAQVHCRGNQQKSEYRFEYSGVKDCNAMFLYFQGDKICKSGCLGQGSCIKVCPVNAISYNSEGLVIVDKEICIACGKCIDVCPTHVMKYVPYSADYIVACNSMEKGAAVRKFCSVGCIGCKVCEKKSPDGGFVVENFLATIDYSQNGDRKAAADACKPGCIVPQNIDNAAITENTRKIETEKENDKQA